MKHLTPHRPWFSLWLPLCLGWVVGLGPSTHAQPQVAPSEITLLAPKPGATFSAPGPVVLEATAVDPVGDIRHLDFYAGERLIGSSDYLLKIAVIPGRPIPHRLEWKDVPVGKQVLTARAKDTLGRLVVSPPVTIEVKGVTESHFPFIRAGAEWRWRYESSGPGEGWRLPTFEDAPWPVGKAELGFGEGDEATVIWKEAGPYPITAYFRRAFEVPADLGFSHLQLRLRRDDGAVVYLNGRELVRDNMPDGAVGPLTLARTATEGGEFRAFTVKPEALVVGRNLVAVEVHQYAATSGDLSFDLELSGVLQPIPTPPTVGIVATRPSTSEPAPTIRVAPGLVTLSRTGPTDAPLVVTLRYEGTATPGEDYVRLPSAVTLPAGASEIALEVQALDDDLDEPAETVVVHVGTPGTAEVGSLAQVTPAYIVDPARASARVSIQDTDEPATLTLTEPREGAVVEVGSTVVLKAVAVDPRGYIGRVVFFDGDTRLGVSEIVFIRAPDPGTPIEHSFEWKGVAAGGHKITVRAVDSTGRELASAPVSFRAGDATSRQVVLAVRAAVGEAVEPSASVPARNGVFVIQRVAGRRDIPVYVACGLAGGAENGVDYAKLPGEITLPAGKDAVEVVVRPLADHLKEGEEKVLLQLRPIPCIAIFPPPDDCYRIEGAGEAVVILRDSPAVNTPPRVALLAPRSGSVSLRGEPIVIEYEATDTDGSVARVDLLVDGHLLRSSTQAAGRVEWKEAAVGTHKLTALAVDNLGAETFSAPVTVAVRDAQELAFVRRELPPAYLPGGALEVVLSAVPPRTAGAWTVEDVPPAGWTIRVEGADAGMDPVGGRVRFGPFTDSLARRLVYQVTPSAQASGVQAFAGSASLDGHTFPVGGEDTIRPAGERHPADRSPADGTLSADEVTGYAAAWKAGKILDPEQGLIPAQYVTRAGQIWRTGGRYSFVPGKGAPPECWVPGAGADAALAGAPEATRERGAGVRRMPAAWSPGVEGTVVLEVTPTPGAGAVCVEEVVPRGWRVVGVGEGGVWDEAGGRIRWGLLYGDLARSLHYTLVPPSEAASNASLEGWVSVDGGRREIEGGRVAGASDAGTALRIAGSRRGDRGRVHLRVDALPDQVFAVEASANLVDWVEVGALVQTGEELVIDDPSGEGQAVRYYRLRPTGR